MSGLDFTSLYGARILNPPTLQGNYVVFEEWPEDELQFIIFRWGDKTWLTTNRSMRWSSVHDGMFYRGDALVSEPRSDRALIEEVAENHSLQLGDFDTYLFFKNSEPLDWSNPTFSQFYREVFGLTDADIEHMRISDVAECDIISG